MLNCVFLLRRSASFLSSFFSEAVILGAFIADQQLDFCITFIQSCNRKQETETYCSKNILFQQKPCSFQHFRNSEKNLCTLHNLHVRAASIGSKQSNKNSRLRVSLLISLLLVLRNRKECWAYSSVYVTFLGSMNLELKRCCIWHLLHSVYNGQTTLAFAASERAK